MRRLLLTVALGGLMAVTPILRTWPVVPVYAAAAHVKSALCQAENATTCVISLATVTVGNSILILSGHTNGGTLSTVDDTANSFTLITTAGTGSGRISGAYICAATSGGTRTITLTYSAAVYAVSVAHEASGLAASSCLDASPAPNVQDNPGTATDAVSSGAATSAENGEYALGLSYETSFTGGPPAAGSSPWIQGQITTMMSAQGTSEYQIQASAGSITATWTAGLATDDFISKITTWKAAAAGGAVRRPCIIGSGFICE
jgi:hypothetical protein